MSVTLQEKQSIEKHDNTKKQIRAVSYSLCALMVWWECLADDCGWFVDNTLKFSGRLAVQISISDYYWCLLHYWITIELLLCCLHVWWWILLCENVFYRGKTTRAKGHTPEETLVMRVRVWDERLLILTLSVLSDRKLLKKKHNTLHTDWQNSTFISYITTILKTRSCSHPNTM